jgi:hypothetical protein
LNQDGSFSYSQTIWINADNKGQVAIYPNPSRGIININSTGTTLLNTTAIIYDAMGKRIRAFVLQSPQQQLNISDLSSGIYILRFEDGTAKAVQKY